MNSLKDYIIVLDNVVTPALCDAVLAEYKDSNDWESAITAGGAPDRERQCSVIAISCNYIVEKNADVRKKLDGYLFTSASHAIQSYKNSVPTCEIFEDYGYDLLRYKTGQFYKVHTDSFKQRPRAVSCSFALNDDYEGGEFAFFDRELVYKLKKGSCIMFPSNFMYPHEIMPVTSGTRYSIVTWFV